MGQSVKPQPLTQLNPTGATSRAQPSHPSSPLPLRNVCGQPFAICKRLRHTENLYVGLETRQVVYGVKIKNSTRVKNDKPEVKSNTDYHMMKKMQEVRKILFRITEQIY
jgi:hypothetical protein